ncbi:hypothetical protein B0A48_14583 [Cryoendolithus antarcticus]|uniref:Apple domain-containing protein n=1 Tax=Cryoendolithus antarcticus TaxID=1507870 RepID=A0A1V8SL63_9PEZI|nr:hypothetical protein B0A48_14583 [Cryoendolithus antarcticus]
MPSMTSLLGLVILALTSTVAGAPTDGPNDYLAEALEKRADAWIAGQSQCPRDNLTVYTGPAGGRYLIKCSVDTEAGGYLAESPANTNTPTNFVDCMALCGHYPGKCTRVSHIGAPVSDGTCYLKGSTGNVKGADQYHKVGTKIN